MATVTLEEARQHLADSQAALTAARFAIQMGDSSQQLSRASVGELARQVSTWARAVQELEAEAAGAENGTVAIASWR